MQGARLGVLKNKHSTYTDCVLEICRSRFTLTSLDLGMNGLGEGGGRARAETLRINTTTTLTSLSLHNNGLGVEQELRPGAIANVFS